MKTFRREQRSMITFDGICAWFEQESAHIDTACKLGYKGAGRLWELMSLHNVGTDRIELAVYRAQISISQFRRRRGREWDLVQMTRPPDRTWFVRVRPFKDDDND